MVSSTSTAVVFVCVPEVGGLLTVIVPATYPYHGCCRRRDCGTLARAFDRTGNRRDIGRSLQLALLKVPIARLHAEPAHAHENWQRQRKHDRRIRAAVARELAKKRNHVHEWVPLKTIRDHRWAGANAPLNHPVKLRRSRIKASPLFREF
jgi:hypothetical protein